MADESPTVRTPTPGGASDTASTGSQADSPSEVAAEPTTGPGSTATSSSSTPPGGAPPGTPIGTPPGGTPPRRVSPLLIIVIAVVGAILFATWRPMLPGVTPTPLP